MGTTGVDAIPAWAWPLLGVVVFVQLAAQVWALVDLIRRPSGDVKGSKWLWGTLIVVASNFALGAILYLSLGRAPERVDVSRPEKDAGDGDRARRAVGVLYGEKEGE